MRRASTPRHPPDGSQHPFLWSEVDEFSHHKRRYTRRELVAKVEAAGLQVRLATSVFSSTLRFCWRAG
jgi:hypothetical protein